MKVSNCLLQGIGLWRHDDALLVGRFFWPFWGCEKTCGTFWRLHHMCSSWIAPNFEQLNTLGVWDWGKPWAFFKISIIERALKRSTIKRRATLHLAREQYLHWLDMQNGRDLSETETQGSHGNVKNPMSH